MWQLTISSILLLPILVSAATPRPVTDFSSFVGLIVDILTLLITITFALTVIAVIWGVVKNWIINGGSAEGVENGKHYAVVGIIVLAIMTSVWGIVYMLRSTLMGN